MSRSITRRDCLHGLPALAGVLAACRSPRAVAGREPVAVVIRKPFGPVAIGHSELPVENVAHVRRCQFDGIMTYCREAVSGGIGQGSNSEAGFSCGGGLERSPC